MVSFPLKLDIALGLSPANDFFFSTLDALFVIVVQWL